MKISKLTLAAVLALTVALTSCGPKDADVQTAVQAKETTGVTVALKDGVATLTGEVADDAAKAKATEIAKAEKGVKDVVNNLTVTQPPPPPPPVVVAADDALTTSVKDAVKDNPTVTATVVGGVVTLAGTIKKADLPKLMQKISTLKPKKIENKLTVN